MMTPVYNVAIADLQTDRCGATRHAARLDFSAISMTKTLRKNNFISLKTHLFSCYLHNVRKYIFQCFHFIFDETTKYLHRTQQPTRNKSLLTNKPSIQDVLSNYLNHNIYTFEAITLRHYNAVKSGTDAPLQQTRFELRVRKSESNVLRGYIKEQPADDTTTTTDEEK